MELTNYLQDFQASFFLNQQSQSVGNVKEMRHLEEGKHRNDYRNDNSCSSRGCVSVHLGYLLFAELADRQDVLPHQWVKQGGRLEVG